ncbi:MAG: hypothetical protein CMJ85_12830 [Planctomycetes bacterium]|jgi:hypothetical protein|nr:hypothetical protein [Planctomycetota bacterium]MDP6423463.1 hypothetical protein [Planctomycetota bacterium]
MLRRFAKIALVGALLLSTGCAEFTWVGRAGGIDEEARDRGVKSVSSLERDYETQRYWAFWRHNIDGVGSALGAGLHSVHESLDRHFLNHSWRSSGTGN